MTHPPLPRALLALALFAAFLPLCAYPVLADGQAATLTLTVVDEATGAPVRGAVVLVDGESVGETDRAGRIAVPRVARGTRQIMVLSDDHAALERTLELAAGPRAVRWQLDGAKPETVQIVEKAVRPKREATEVVLAQEEVKSVPGTFGDPVRVVENLPGMSRTPGGFGGALIVRGANPADSGVYLDGVEVPLLYHFGGLTSVVNAEFLGDVTFLPGGFGAQYGRATAGVVEVRSKSLACDRVRASAAVDPIDAEAFACVPLGRWRLAAAARRSYVDAFLPTLLDQAAEGESATIVSPSYFDYQLKAERTTARQRFEIFAFGARDGLTVSRAGSAEDADMALSGGISFHRLQLRHTYFWGERASLESALTPGLMTQDFGDESKELGTQHHARVEIGTISLRETLTVALAPQLKLRGGLDHQLWIWNADFVTDLPTLARQFPSPLEIDPTRQSPWKTSSVDLNQAYWGELVLQPRADLALTSGMRVSRLDFDRTARWTFEPRLAARWQVVPTTAVKASSGIYRKLPDPMSGVIVSGFGQPNLAAERAIHATGGVEHDFGPLAVTLEGFHVWRDRLPSPTDEVRFVDGKAEPVLFRSDGRGRSLGLELLVRRNAAEERRFSGWVAYTLSRSLRRDRSADGPGLDQIGGNDPASPRLDDLPDQSREYLSPFDQTHILTTVGRWALPWKMSLGFRFQYVSGNPMTPLEKGTVRYDADRDAHQVEPGSVARNSDRLPAFHRLDLRLDKRWDFRAWNLTAYLEVVNSYNRRSVEAIGYDYRYRSRTALRGLPILPIIGLKGEI